MDKFLESVNRRDFDRRISEVTEMLVEKQLYGTISLIKDLKYYLDFAMEEKASCNCHHNSNPRDNEPCCRCDSKKTNADRIRNMSDEELAEFMSENTSYYYCGVRCKDRPNSPSESSCNFRWLEWLQSKTE